jgi:hypothetical protein
MLFGFGGRSEVVHRLRVRRSIGGDMQTGISLRAFRAIGVGNRRDAVPSGEVLAHYTDRGIGYGRSGYLELGCRRGRVPGSIDPMVLAIAGYIVVSAGTDKVLQSARTRLSSDAKLRLLEGFDGLWPASYVPVIGWIVLFGAGLILWPSRALGVSYAGLVVLTFATTVLWWRRLATLGMDDAYLRAWKLSRSVRIVALAALCAYLIYYSASWEP